MKNPCHHPWVEQNLLFVLVAQTHEKSAKQTKTAKIIIKSFSNEQNALCKKTNNMKRPNFFGKPQKSKNQRFPPKQKNNQTMPKLSNFEKRRFSSNQNRVLSDLRSLKYIFQRPKSIFERPQVIEKYFQRPEKVEI